MRVSQSQGLQAWPGCHTIFTSVGCSLCKESYYTAIVYFSFSWHQLLRLNSYAALDTHPRLLNDRTLGAFDTLSLDLIHSCTVLLKI